MHKAESKHQTYAFGTCIPVVPPLVDWEIQKFLNILRRAHRMISLDFHVN